MMSKKGFLALNENCLPLQHIFETKCLPFLILGVSPYQVISELKTSASANIILLRQKQKGFLFRADGKEGGEINEKQLSKPGT